jgi:hypothetical protein
VDPGLVHTGVVELVFDSARKDLEIIPTTVVGPDADAVRQVVNPKPWNQRAVFIEGYRPRSNFGTDQRMVVAVKEMKDALRGAIVLNNTGVKKVVKKPLMQLLEVWSFPTVTHHQDLRSAARIALLGMLKDPALNRLLSDMVRDHLKGGGWNVHVTI